MDIKLPHVPYWCTILLLVCSLLSSSQAKKPCHRPSSGSSSNQDPSNMYTLSNTFDNLPGYLFPSNSSSSTFLSDGLGSYKKQPHPPLSEPGLFVIADQLIELWRDRGDGTILEASFNVEFTMSIYQPNNSLTFGIIPEDFLHIHESLATLLNCTLSPSDENIVDDNQFAIRAGELYPMIFNNTVPCVYISITERPSWSNTKNYNFSIHYNPHPNKTVQVSVVDVENGQQSIGYKAGISFSNMSSQGLFSFSSSMGQLFQLHTWNSTVDRLVSHHLKNSHKKKETTIIILSSVLGSAAATVATAAVVYFYFHSKYRGWKKELDELAKTMQLLPGVPTQFSFSDIRRATNNFHETTKLGRGGFGAVYRCRLPGPKKGEAMEVAVKRFSRDDNRRYEDFLAEVSVINRLRHKNIVPLVGWSYNKGEPLLIYEYMPNGSLDQHLFGRSGGKQQQPTNKINRWGTRYNMVKDIATGLHYVHHEYEPRVLHRDIKANNIMIDSTFQGRLGDFGLACVVAEGKNSYTDIGAPGTLGFRAPEYIHSGKATTKSDIFAFGVLILEIVTGKVAVAQFCHITDWVWRLHREGRLLDAIDPLLTTEFNASDAKRLLLLGLACSQPNPSDRPTMVEAMQIITQSAPPPDVPLEKPRFVWPPEGLSLSSDYSTELSSLGSSLTTIGIEMTERGQASSSENGGNSLHHRPIAGPSQELFSIYHTAE
ncbi:putative L-type lectin-domain containing receptor kinase S.5 [Dichanthelium oligosanthes]|uniref:Putative L-type lectin-domain containing receptor kinase S.5 n=1 Tax=Dichanthelium oligosanthes TaxID=888268 RepID=A0A1E5WF00_9POAL|nr:putative L-type lectin-domain containing receptor kinase S.5 [Dichanthelium oligosanthes]